LRLYQALGREVEPAHQPCRAVDAGRFQGRHIADSAFLMRYAPENPRLWADFGAGGGLPGLVVATIAQARGWDTRVVLVESDARKATFLREAARQMGLAVDVRAERVGIFGALSGGCRFGPGAGRA
jgi:16S rRNA (guanine527-N7)-methyltransferase